MASLVSFFQEKIGDPTLVTDFNPFQGIQCSNLLKATCIATCWLNVGEDGVDFEGSDFRVKKPWVFIKKVAEGVSAPIGYNSRMAAQKYVEGYLHDYM